MKTNEETATLLNSHATPKGICRLLDGQTVPTFARQKEEASPQPDEEVRHWSGQPGQDLFFNDWKLLF